MKTEFKFSYPSSEKVYLSGRLYPELKVGMRKVHLTPTVTIKKGERCEDHYKHHWYHIYTQEHCFPHIFLLS